MQHPLPLALVSVLFGCSLLGPWASSAGAQAKPPSMDEMHRLHQDSKAYIAALEDPARDAYQKPHEVVMALGLQDGERVADIGSGPGYFTLRIARHVGAGGRVTAVDISPDMILELNKRVRDAALDNVRTILALPDDPLLAPASLDLVFICDTWHHIGNHVRYLGLLEKTLRPGGRVVIVDYQKRETPVGPPLEIRLSRESVVKEFEQSGWRLVQEPTFLPYQYFLAFSPPKAR